MDKNSYRKLCSMMDGVLADKQITFNTIANHYLHILNAHPHTLKKYKSNNGFIKKLLELLRFKIVTFARVLQSLFDANSYYSSNSDQEVKVLLVSHLTNRNQLGKESDNYFGDLSEQLLHHGISSNYALINHVKIKKWNSIDAWKNTITARHVLSSSLNFFKEIEIYLWQWKAWKQLKRILDGNKAMLDNVKSSALLYSFSSETANAIRIGLQISQLLKKTKANILITTFEGHSWECLVYGIARKMNPNIKCLGYQAAVVFEYQHAIKRIFNDLYYPDIVLASGRISQKIFEKIISPKIPVLRLGSYKMITTFNADTKKGMACLVIPEGIESECLLLFSMSLACAKRHPEHQFIWRLHPLIDFITLTKKNQIFRELPANIICSNQMLEEDASQCNTVLYRGSTAVINAISLGCKPIYYRRDDEISIDAIFQLNKAKSIVTNDTELSQVLQSKVTPEEEQELRQFAEDFYTPFNPEVIVDLLR